MDGEQREPTTMGQQGSKDRTLPRRTDFARDSTRMRLGSFKRGRRGWIFGRVILLVCIACDRIATTSIDDYLGVSFNRLQLNCSIPRDNIIKLVIPFEIPMFDLMMFHVAMFSLFIFREIADVRKPAPKIRLERPR